MKLSLQYFLIDQQALQRSLGMMQLMGGSVTLASVFSDRQLEKPLTHVGEFVLCLPCMVGRLGALFDKLEPIQSELDPVDHETEDTIEGGNR